MAEVTVKFIEPPVNIDVDMSKITWRDLIELQKVQRQGGDEEQAIEAVTKIVSRITGQDAWDLPAQVVAKVVEEMMTMAGLGGTAKN